MPHDRSDSTAKTFAGDSISNLYGMILDNIDRAVIAFDSDGRITLFNPAAEALMECSSRQIVGKSYQDLFKNQETLLYLVKVALKEGRSITDDEGLFLHRSNASPLPVNAYTAPIFAQGGNQNGAVMIIRDLSRIKELEGTLRRADRLSMLGTLAAGLAHEIKNPLGGIKGAAQLLSMELSKGSPLQDYTQIMIKEVERINFIIEELMDLGSPREPEVGDVDLARVFNDIVLLQREAARSRNIQFKLKLDPSIPPVQGDEGLLTRLFLNLIKNAGESISREGVVVIETRIASNYHMTGPGRRSSPMVDIIISDTGCGIDQQEMDRIFTPYFTTKSKGSGLGLAISQKIIEDHNGLLKIESTPHQGTTVTISLPLRR
ncbi:MAG: PAS domain S-box protein [Deltaproteobacteria bacterium]|jgi:two-component system nitrogen regulation sensor histidine kinase GlnL|nr:PAS domain S-box protein [Deltaproteobacteria bacterium]MDH4007074.1 ATP-binding protein [Desulfuromonadales bacterium]